MPFDTDLVTTPSDMQGNERLESALQLLLEGDFQARWEATKHISALGKSAIAYLIPLLKDEELDWEIRWFAARTLGKFDDEAALQALINLLQQTQEAELITIAAEGVSRFGENGVDALVQLFANPIHRITAIQALASIRHQAALQPLIAAARDTDPEVRIIALSALGNFRTLPVDRSIVCCLRLCNLVLTPLGKAHEQQERNSRIDCFPASYSGAPGCWLLVV